MLKHVQGSVFDAPPEGYLVHACNCKGVWGSGVALEFHNRFPEAYRAYKAYCEAFRECALGTALLVPEKIICLFTSNGYGRLVDKPEQIIENTQKSLKDLMAQIEFAQLKSPVSFHSPKINAGLFKVPWELTEKVIIDTVKEPHSWTVYTP